MTKTLMNYIGTGLIVVGIFNGVIAGAGYTRNINGNLNYEERMKTRISQQEAQSQDKKDYLNLGAIGLLGITSGIFFKEYSNLKKTNQKL